MVDRPDQALSDLIAASNASLTVTPVCTLMVPELNAFGNGLLAGAYALVTPLLPIIVPTSSEPQSAFVAGAIVAIVYWAAVLVASFVKPSF
jgi:hypothetical protein